MKNKINKVKVKVKVGTYKDYSGTVVNVINTNLCGVYSVIGYCSCGPNKNVKARTYNMYGVFHVPTSRDAPKNLDLDLSTYVKPKSKYRPGKIKASIESKSIVPGIYKNKTGDTVEVVKILEDTDTQ